MLPRPPRAAPAPSAGALWCGLGPPRAEPERPRVRAQAQTRTDSDRLGQTRTAQSRAYGRVSARARMRRAGSARDARAQPRRPKLGRGKKALVCVDEWTCANINAHTHTRTHAHSAVSHTRTHAHTHTHTQARTHKRARAHTQTHTHTQSGRRRVPGGVEAGHEEGGQSKRVRGAKKPVSPPSHDIQGAQLLTFPRTSAHVCGVISEVGLGTKTRGEAGLPTTIRYPRAEQRGWAGIPRPWVELGIRGRAWNHDPRREAVRKVHCMA